MLEQWLALIPTWKITNTTSDQQVESQASSSQEALPLDEALREEHSLDDALTGNEDLDEALREENGVDEALTGNKDVDKVLREKEALDKIPREKEALDKILRENEDLDKDLSREKDEGLCLLRIKDKRKGVRRRKKRALNDDEDCWSKMSRDNIHTFLTDHRMTLMGDLEPWNFLPYLRTKRIIDKATQERIEGKYISTFDRMGHLLDVVETKGPTGFQAFMEMFQYENPFLYLRLTEKEPKPLPDRGFKPHPRASHSQAVLQELLQKIVKMMDDMRDHNDEVANRIKAYEEDYNLIQEVEKEKEIQKVEKRHREMSRRIRDFEKRSMEWKEKYLEQMNLKIKKAEECEELRKQRDDHFGEAMTMREKLAEAELELKRINERLTRQTSNTQHSLIARDQMLQLKAELAQQKQHESSAQELHELHKVRCKVAELEQERIKLQEDCSDLRDKVEEAETSARNGLINSEKYKQQSQQMQAERDQALERLKASQACQEEAETSSEKLNNFLSYYRTKCKALEQQVIDMEMEKKQLISVSKYPEHVHLYHPVLPTTVGDVASQEDKGLYAQVQTRHAISSDDSEDEKGTMIRPGRSKRPIQEHHLLPATIFGHQVETIDLYGMDHRAFFNRAYSLHEVKVSAEVLQGKVKLIGGNLIGIFVSHVDESAGDCGLLPGDQICQIRPAEGSETVDNLEKRPLEEACHVIENSQGELSVIKGVNYTAYQTLNRALDYFSGQMFTGDFFCVCVRNNTSCWKDEHLTVDQGTILLVTNTLYTENNWFATIVNPPDGTTLDHGPVPSGWKRLSRVGAMKAIKKSRSSDPSTGFRQNSQPETPQDIKPYKEVRPTDLGTGFRQNSQLETYKYIKPYKALYKRPLLLTGNQSLVTSVTEILPFPQVTSSELGQASHPPGSPRNTIQPPRPFDASSQEPQLKEFVQKVQNSQTHLLLPQASATMLLEKMQSLDIYPIIIQLKLNNETLVEASWDIINQLEPFEYESLTAASAAASDVQTLVREVMDKVKQTQDHLIWATTSSPETCV